MDGPINESGHVANGVITVFDEVSKGFPAASLPETHTSTMYVGRSVVAPPSVKSKLPLQKNCSPKGVVSGNSNAPREISASPALTR